MSTLFQGLQGKTPIWSTHNGPEFRDERDAHDVIRLRHTGWFTDIHCDESAVGIVARLTHGRFIAGYRWMMNGERVYFPEVFTDEEEAARMADSHAEAFADLSREDSERFDAMCRAEGHVEAVERDVDMAYQARNVSAKHRAHCIDRIEELRAARADLAEATAAYEKG